MSKHFTLLLILLLTTPVLLTAEPVFSDIPKPSVPEFTLELVDKSYDVPTSYSIDPYTGENVTHLGYHVEQWSIEIAIENQLFEPYFSEGFMVNFYYNIRTKGHYAEAFRSLYNPSDGYLPQSNSEYTFLSIPADYPYGAKVDFQVEALIGYCRRIQLPDATAGPWSFPWIFTGETSGWSKTQTLIISNPPKLCIDSPKNTTYTTSTVNLQFTVDTETSWMGYSLDGQSYIFITENTMKLIGLAEGSHNLTVYASDNVGNVGKSETVYFTVAVSDIPIEPITTSVMAILALAAASILIYFVKTRRKKGNEELDTEGDSSQF